MTLAFLPHLPAAPSGRRLVRRAVAAAAGAAALTAGIAGAASAANNGSTTANVVVESAITLTGLTPSFTLTGIPGQVVTTVSQTQTVRYNVATNNTAGYSVTVTPAANALTASTSGNSDTIPVTDLYVTRDGGYTAFIDSSTPIVVHTSTGPTTSAGDDLNSDLGLQIPYVKNDTYSATLNYLASTL